ncbi:MAG: hypothetical protein LLG01_06970 [Planctomycetaceae bacterium]|nr:hypothetical protein [Planctomycetaceae bacterium]
MQMQPPPSPYVPATRTGLSGFVKGFAITDLVMCCIRAIVVMFSAIGWASLSADSELYRTAPFEVFSGLGIVMLGVPGNIMILMKKKVGCVLGWGNVIFTCISIGVAVWQIPMLHRLQTGPAAAGFVGGTVLGLVVRLALLIVYIMVVARAAKEIDALSQAQGIAEMPPASVYATRP